MIPPARIIPRIKVAKPGAAGVVPTIAAGNLDDGPGGMESFGEEAYERESRWGTPASRKEKAGVPWRTAALLSGKCDGSAIHDCTEHDIFVRNKNSGSLIFHLQVANEQHRTSSAAERASISLRRAPCHNASILALALDCE